jgi:predicted O-methyltransferase YrrM
MRSIRKSIKAILNIIKNPWLLNNVLSDDTIWINHLKSKYTIPIGLPVIALDKLSPLNSETINTFSFLDGGSLPTDIALLKVLCKRFNPCNYFEIGTWRGESVMNVSEICNECYTLNLSKSELLKQGGNERYADLHGFFSKNKENIIHLYGNSLNFDFQSLGKKFDVIFIDGNHHHEFVKSDTEKVFKHLVHDKSIIVWHDYAYNPEKPRPEVLAAILDGVEIKNHKYLYHVANTLCAVFIR